VAGLTHSEIQELLGAYALDAVDPDEADAVERHLGQCPRCADEVASHREVAATMANAGAPAPDGVWHRIVEGLEDVPPALDLAPVTALHPGRLSLPVRPVAALAAAAAVVIGALGVQAVRQDRRIDRLPDIIEKRGLDEAVAAALFDAGARRVHLRSEDGRLSARAVVQPNGNGYLVPENLPPLPPERTYQLWGVVGTRTVSVGVLGPEPSVAAFKADADLSLLAITEEQAGGVTATQNRPVVRGTLPVS
jgi:anti-sigma factor RsiW